MKVRLTVFRRALGAHPYLIGIRVNFSGGKVARVCCRPNTPYNAEAKNEWSLAFTLPYASMVCTGTCLPNIQGKTRIFVSPRLDF